MIGHAVDLDCGGFKLVEDAAKIRVQVRAEFRRDERPAEFGAEHQVGDQSCQ